MNAEPHLKVRLRQTWRDMRTHLSLSGRPHREGKTHTHKHALLPSKNKGLALWDSGEAQSLPAGGFLVAGGLSCFPSDHTWSPDCRRRRRRRWWRARSPGTYNSPHVSLMREHDDWTWRCGVFSGAIFRTMSLSSHSALPHCCVSLQVTHF